MYVCIERERERERESIIKTYHQHLHILTECDGVRGLTNCRKYIYFYFFMLLWNLSPAPAHLGYNATGWARGHHEL
jgi:hypothetical protein